MSVGAAGADSSRVRLAGRLTRHASIYTLAATFGVLAGVLGVVIFTRYLDPAQFGRLAVLSTMASMVTVIANLAVLQGTMRRVYGSSGDEDMGEDSADTAILAGDVRLSLSTGLVLTAVVGCGLLAGAWVWREPLADLLVDRSAEGKLVVLSFAAGAMAAVMRLGRNFVRIQRRPLAYLAITLTTTMGGTLAASALLIAGLAVEGVLIGFTVGSSAAVALTVYVLRRDLRWAVSLREGVAIVRSGLYYVPIVVSLQVIQLGDVLLVAQLASFRDTGLYRVAQRIAMPVTYGTSVFIQAWGPMRRDLVHVAADREHGEEWMSARLVTYYALFVSGLVLAVSIFADQLVVLAAGEYDDAAALAPLTALGIAGHGWFVMSYRVSTAERKRTWFVLLSMLAAVAFLTAAVLLVPPLGAAGAPIAAICAWAPASIAMVAIGQAGPRPVPFEYGKLAAIALATGGTWAVGLLLPDSLLGVVAKGGLLAAWAAALVAFDAIPVNELRSLGRFMRHTAGAESRRGIRSRMSRLDPVDRELVESLVNPNAGPGSLAARAGISESELLVRGVHALRAVTGGGVPTAFDAAIGELLFTPMARAEQDHGLRALVEEGLDPLDADRLLRACQALGARSG